jgi:sRNA-binding protein
MATKSERKRQARTTLAKLAKLYPAFFAANASEPHRPLKIGIHRDLIERGLQPSDAQALKLYVGRMVYQSALAAGGPRYNLDGHACGEVTAEQMADALAKIEAVSKTAQDRREAERIERDKTRTEEGRKAFENIRAARIEREAKATGRLGLAGLKAAAQARKAAHQAA